MEKGYESYLGIDLSFALLEIKKLKESEKENVVLVKALEYVESKVILAYNEVRLHSLKMPEEYEELHALNRAIQGINLTYDANHYSTKEIEKYDQEPFDMVIAVLEEKRNNLKEGRSV